MNLWKDGRPDCHMCTTIIEALVANGKGEGVIPRKATSLLTISSIGNQLLGGRNAREMLLCSKHHRQLTRTLDKVVEDSLESYA